MIMVWLCLCDICFCGTWIIILTTCTCTYIYAFRKWQCVRALPICRDKKKRKEVPICNISYSDKVVIRFIMNSKSLSIVPITLFIYILHLYNSKYFLWRNLIFIKLILSTIKKIVFRSESYYQKYKYFKQKNYFQSINIKLYLCS